MMNTPLRLRLIAALLACCVLSSSASDRDESPGEELQRPDRNMKLQRSNTAANVRRPKEPQRRKLKESQRVSTGPRNDAGCIRLGGICPGPYLKDRCSGAKTRQCCSPAGAWSVFCAGHHGNRVRACDVHGCGAFSSRSRLFTGYIVRSQHGAVDLVCDDYGTVNAPFSGSLAGPVSRTDAAGNQFDGVKLLNRVHCVKIFNIRPYRYIGPVVQGEALGYLLPLQERFSGITSHLELQRCVTAQTLHRSYDLYPFIPTLLF